MLVGWKTSKVTSHPPSLLLILFLIYYLSLVATLKTVAPQILQHLTTPHPGPAAPIPEEMPLHFAEGTRRTFHVEGIGEPTNACFLNAATADPTHWYAYQSSNYHLGLIDYSIVPTLIGGCLRNMMACVRFGIPRRNNFILAEATCCRYLKRLSTRCPPICFLTASYGNLFPLLPQQLSSPLAHK